MKRPTANVSGDNPGDSAPVAGEERDQTLFHLGVAPPHVSSPDWFLQYGYLATHLFWQLLTSFTWPGEQGHYIPREYPFAVA